MKFMPAIAALLPLSVALSATAGETYHNQVSAGWLYVKTNDSSDELRTTINGNTSSAAGTSSELNDASTLGLTYTYFFNDNWSGQFVGGVPPEFELSGKGQTLFGDLGSFNKLATVRQWSPTLLGIYTFGTPAQALRPYVGLGVSYTRFDNIELDPAFEAALQTGGKSIVKAGAYAKLTAAGMPPANALATATAVAAATNVTVDAKADSSVDPVVTVGLDYRLTERWYAQLSASYLPLSTTATVTVKSPTGTLATSKASMDINPVVGFLGIGYRF